MAYTYRNIGNTNTGDTWSSPTARPDLLANGNWVLISDTLDDAAIAAVAAMNARQAAEAYEAALIAAADQQGRGDVDPRYARVAGGGLEQVYTATAGATITVDVANGNVQQLTLGANTTVTLTGATTGKACSVVLYLVQDGTGGRTITWPAAVKWAGGTPPVLSTAAAARDAVVLETINGGTTWFGAPSGLDYK